MKLCFMSNFYKTVFFQEIAKRLKSQGHMISWIATSDKWRQWLISQGATQEDVLLLRRDEAYLIEEEHISRAFNQVEPDGGTLRRVYYMDRIVRNWEWSEARQYFGYVLCRVCDFIERRGIETVVGEATMAHEILTAMYCKTQSVSYLCPHTTRIPGDRFCFFEGHLQKKIVSMESHLSEKECESLAVQARDDVVLRNAKPAYWHWANRKPRVDGRYVGRALDKVREALVESGRDATVKPLRYHLSVQPQYLKPWWYRKAVKSNLFEEPRDNERFVLYTLHKQPEASVDVIGSDYSNQLEVIKAIARNLPDQLQLYVKEHANSLGDRSPEELKEIKNIPGVRLIDPATDIHSLIRTAALVTTISGTVAFEAGLHGVPAVTFADMYFEQLSRVTQIHSPQQISAVLRRNWAAYDFKQEDLGFMSKLVANSAEGLIGDPNVAPASVTEENIEKVTGGFNRMLAALSKPEPLEVAV